MAYDSLDDTSQHILEVQERIWDIVSRIEDRGKVHDGSKLVEGSIEKQVMDQFTPKLKELEYWGPEYMEILNQMGEGLQEHYRNNRHHPEHFQGTGILGMTLVDIVEMFCNWAAATLRMKDGDLGTSIEKNKERFGISDQLTQIFHNTAFALGWETEEEEE